MTGGISAGAVKPVGFWVVVVVLVSEFVSIEIGLWCFLRWASIVSANQWTCFVVRRGARVSLWL